jgi:hypothetical protein
MFACARRRITIIIFLIAFFVALAANADEAIHGEAAAQNSDPSTRRAVFADAIGTGPYGSAKAVGALGILEVPDIGTWDSNIFGGVSLAVGYAFNAAARLEIEGLLLGGDISDDDKMTGYEDVKATLCAFSLQANSIAAST